MTTNIKPMQTNVYVSLSGSSCTKRNEKKEGGGENQEDHGGRRYRETCSCALWCGRAQSCGNAENLKEIILQNFKISSGKLIYVTGETISSNLDKKLILEGYNLKRIINYKAIHQEKFNSEEINKLKDEDIKIDNQSIIEVLTVNGVRFSLEDGSWGLIRASSNKPSLVIVTESTKSNESKKKIFEFIDNLLQKTGKIGDYEQKI